MSDIKINMIYNRYPWKKPDEINEITVNGVKYPIGHLDVDSRWDLQIFLKYYDLKHRGGNNDDVLSKQEQKAVDIAELEKIIYYNPRVASNEKTPLDILEKIAAYKGENRQLLMTYLANNRQITTNKKIMNTLKASAAAVARQETPSTKEVIPGEDFVTKKLGIDVDIKCLYDKDGKLTKTGQELQKNIGFKRINDNEANFYGYKTLFVGFVISYPPPKLRSRIPISSPFVYRFKNDNVKKIKFESTLSSPIFNPKNITIKFLGEEDKITGARKLLNEITVYETDFKE